MLPTAIDTVRTRSNVDLAVRHLEQTVAPGDVVASHVGGRLPLLAWSLGVRHHIDMDPVTVRVPADSKAFLLGNHAPSGRTWMLVSTSLPHSTPRTRCAPDWSVGALRVLCLPNAAILKPFDRNEAAHSGGTRFGVGI